MPKSDLTNKRQKDKINFNILRIIFLYGTEMYVMQR